MMFEHWLHARAMCLRFETALLCVENHSPEWRDAFLGASEWRQQLRRIK